MKINQKGMVVGGGGGFKNSKLDINRFVALYDCVQPSDCYMYHYYFLIRGKQAGRQHQCGYTSLFIFASLAKNGHDLVLIICLSSFSILIKLLLTTSKAYKMTPQDHTSAFLPSYFSP